jgi:hypothetical protein
MSLGACTFKTVCASPNLKTGLECSRISTYFVCSVSDLSPIFYERRALKRADASKLVNIVSLNLQ